MKPLIGISGRRFAAARIKGMEVRYQPRSVDMYFSDFARCVAAAGGVPVELPYEAAGEVAPHLDGLILSGGQDVSRQHGGAAQDVTHDTEPDRDLAEITLARSAIRHRVPILAICRGLQILNVARGGTLVPDLPYSPTDHQQIGHGVAEETHEVIFTAGSLASRVYGDTTRVNSLHHQAAARVGDGLIVSGISPSDGVVETLEMQDHGILAVQWHPEWREDDPAFHWLVENARLAGRVSRGTA
ncbi:gamma-glutamyl-gamma-aminobutyrate hydrolase family protein [Pseudarthrobacter sp. NKDBFgelt]|uniref:gamma-glutamyl-gamma-aminobutyrate hydrolase family protein n=1 Tax=Pseudarthrobacter sp. NKDBFgelt TaxID=3384443 RepID=UPI0038D358DC